MPRLPDKDGKSVLIDATIAILREHGLADTTVRKIAKKAEVAPGLVTHHFSGKEALIAAAYKKASYDLVARFIQSTLEAPPGSINKLRAFIDASFEPQNLNEDNLRLWASFWMLVLSDPRARQAQFETNRHYQQTIGNLLIDVLREHVPERTGPDDMNELSIAVTALLDGLWLGWCLDPSSVDGQARKKIALGLISKILDVDLGNQ